jgi:hypothetical protein
VKKQKLLGIVFVLAGVMDAAIAFAVPVARIPMLVSAGAMLLLGVLFLV